MSVQTKFEVCVGVRSGPKGPVIDLSIFGLESRWGTFWAEGPVIDISICGVQSIWEPLQIVKGWGGCNRVMDTCRLFDMPFVATA